MNRSILILAALMWQTAAPAAAKSWSGFLVSSACYESEESNTNPTDTDTYVDRDRDLEVRLCTPNAKTKSFTLVDHDGLSYKLDPAGNAKAAELVRQARKKRVLEVTVTGEVSKDRIRVDSISPVP